VKVHLPEGARACFTQLSWSLRLSNHYPFWFRPDTPSVISWFFEDRQSGCDASKLSLKSISSMDDLR
jgi:hypothetical protein